MINLSFIKAAGRRIGRAPGMLLILALAGLLLLVISCGTVTRSVVELPEVPGAKYIGSQECEQCHEENRSRVRHR